MSQKKPEPSTGSLFGKMFLIFILVTVGPYLLSKAIRSNTEPEEEPFIIMPAAYDDVFAASDEYVEKPAVVYGETAFFFRADDGSALLYLVDPKSPDLLNHSFLAALSADVASNFDPQPGDCVKVSGSLAANYTQDTIDTLPASVPGILASSVAMIDALPTPADFAEEGLRSVFKGNFISLRYDENSNHLEVIADTASVSRSQDPQQFFTFHVYDCLKAVRPLLDSGMCSFDTFTIRLKGGLVDQYGNPTDSTAFVAVFDSATIQAINFEHIPLDALRPLATNWIVHPAFK